MSQKDGEKVPKLSVIIVAYRNGKVLQRCLESLVEYNDMGQDLEVIIVDNSPDEEKVQGDIQKTSLLNYQYISSDNRGFGAGNNLGVEKSRGNIVAFINPDIIFIQPVFAAFYREFENDKNLMMAGGRLLQENGQRNISFYYDYGRTIMKKGLTKIRNRFDLFNEKSMYISGADLFVRKNDFINAGMFDENIFMYYEEADLIRRLRSINTDGRIAYYKDYKMVHLEGKSTPNSLFALQHELDSSLYYGKKYGLKYKERFKFEYNYRRLKCLAYSFTNKEKYEEMRAAIKYTQEHYAEYI